MKTEKDKANEWRRLAAVVDEVVVKKTAVTLAEAQGISSTRIGTYCNDRRNKMKKRTKLALIVLAIIVLCSYALGGCWAVISAFISAS